MTGSVGRAGKLSSAVQLRRMRWWDIPEVLELERLAFRVDPWAEVGFWAELAHVPGTRYYVVAHDAAGSILGYAGLFAAQREADVQTVAVAPDHQRTGIGRTLVDDLIAEAARRRCSQVMLEVREENLAAQRLYESFGFESISRRRGYYGPGVDAVVMRLRPVVLPGHS